MRQRTVISIVMILISLMTLEVDAKPDSQASDLEPEESSVERQRLVNYEGSKVRLFTAATLETQDTPMTAWCQVENSSTRCFLQAFDNTGDPTGSPVPIFPKTQFCPGLGDLRWLEGNRFAVVKNCHPGHGSHLVLQTGQVGGGGGQESRIVSVSEAQHYQPRLVAPDREGRFWLIWIEAVEGFSTDGTLWGQRFDDDATPLGEPLQLSEFGAVWSTLGFDVAAISNGDMTLVWPAVVGRGQRIMLERRLPDGSRLTDPVVVAPDHQEPRHPRLSTNPEGWSVVVWEGLPRDRRASVIFMRTFDNQGIARSEGKAITEPSDVEQYHPVPVIRGTEIFVAWRESLGPGATMDLRAVIVDRHGEASTPPVLLAPDIDEILDYGSRWGAGVVDGNFVVYVWHYLDTGKRTRTLESFKVVEWPAEPVQP